MPDSSELKAALEQVWLPASCVTVEQAKDSVLPRPCRDMTTPSWRQQAGSWERFDIFTLSRLSGGRPLQTITWHLLNQLGVVESLALPRAQVLNFLQVSFQCSVKEDLLVQRLWSNMLPLGSLCMKMSSQLHHRVQMCIAKRRRG